jgi:hypothetical protein
VEIVEQLEHPECVAPHFQNEIPPESHELTLCDEAHDESYSMASTVTGHVWSAEGARYAGQPEDAREADAPVKEAEEQLRRTLRKPKYELHPCELKEADSCTPEMISEDLDFGSRPSMEGPPAVKKQVEPELECDSETQTEDRTEHSALSTAIKDCPKPPTERAQELERMKRAAPRIRDSEHLTGARSMSC